MPSLRTFSLVILAFCVFVVTSTSALALRPSRLKNVRSSTRHSFSSLRMAKEKDPSTTNASFGFIGGIGCAANLVLDYSLYVLQTTGCNVVPKDSVETLIAEQGVSLVGIIGLFAWSLVTKKQTGTGLPSGPAGLLGAAEGLTFLTVLAGIVVAAINIATYGGLTAGDACADLTYTKALGFM